MINLYMNYLSTQPAGGISMFDIGCRYNISISNTPTIALERKIFKMQA